MELLAWAEDRSGPVMHERKRRGKLVNWCDRMETGIREVDEQHRQLVDMVNRLSEAMYAGQGRNILGYTLASLEKYAMFHFGAEERLMAAHCYSETAEHKRGHESFISIIRRFRHRFDAGHIIVPAEILFFLREWLIVHIMMSDRDMARELAQA